MNCELNRKRSQIEAPCVHQADVSLKRFKRPVEVAGMIIEEEDDGYEEFDLLESYHSMLDEINRKELKHLIREYNLAKHYFSGPGSHN